jgi:hypothetical protein
MDEQAALIPLAMAPVEYAIDETLNHFIDDLFKEPLPVRISTVFIH